MTSKQTNPTEYAAKAQAVAKAKIARHAAIRNSYLAANRNPYTPSLTVEQYIANGFARLSEVCPNIKHEYNMFNLPFEQATGWYDNVAHDAYARFRNQFAYLDGVAKLFDRDAQDYLALFAITDKTVLFNARGACMMVFEAIEKATHCMNS